MEQTPTTKEIAMCGIAGFSLAESVRRVDTITLTRTLLLGIEERGRDATGVAWADPSGEVWIHKHNVRARDFVSELEGAGARAGIAHTRFATKGAPETRANNHPVEHHGIVAVHNGVIWNDDAIFATLGSPKRHGTVDSEAAAALIARAPEVFGVPAYEALSLIEGSAALAWLDVNDKPGTLHLARVASSPLVVAQTRLGSTLFASTRKALLEAAMKSGFRIRYINELPEGSYLKVEQGKIVEVRRFEKPSRTAPARKVYYPKATGKAAPRPRGPQHGITDRMTASGERTYSWLNPGLGS